MNVKEMRYAYILFLLGGFLVSVFIYSILSAISTPLQTPETPSAPIHVKETVEIYHNGELVETLHNVVYNAGLEMVENAVFGEGIANVSNISLCNVSAGCGIPVADESEAYTSYTGCGLEEGEGTFTSYGDGNWSVQKTFTSSCDAQSINATRLSNDSDGNFAGLNITSTTVQNGDTITINWTGTASSG